MTGSVDGFSALVEAVHRKVIDTLAEDPMPAVDIAGVVRALAPLTPTHVLDDVVARVAARVHGMGPLEPLLADASVSEVMINGPGPVWIERGGTVSRSVCRWTGPQSIWSSRESCPRWAAGSIS